jgi:hypothetical protein
MRRNPRLFRLSASVAVTALLSNSLLPLAAAAQPAPPSQPEQALPDLNRGDPPARVGRVAGIEGQVSYRTGGDTEWSAASVNYPVSSGYAAWTQPSATASLEISACRIVLAGTTEFSVTSLDAGGLLAVAAQGETYMHLRDLAPAEVWSVQTPRGLVRLTGGGRYGIVAGTTEQPTLITVVDGVADIEGPNLSLQVSANQTATVTGADNFLGSIGPIQRDPFLNAQLAAERPPPRMAAAIPQQVAAMPGGSDLVATGSWAEAPQYGQVWYPPVNPGWVPYRHGHWAFVAPWGWTWVDDAQWGFAPFHYGRWLEVGGRWAWTPGEVAVAGPPVYAPALVTFIGIGAGVAVGAALAAGAIGWIPLGPREAYHPWYHASDNYIRQVNINHVTKLTNINNVTVNNFINRGAATSVPAAALTGSRPIQGFAQPVTAQQFASATPVVGRQPLAPTAATSGITPVVARQLNLSPAGAPVHPAAPGPVVSAAAAAPGFRPPLAGPGGSHAPGQVSPAAAAVSEHPAVAGGANVPGGHPPLLAPGENHGPPEVSHAAATASERPAVSREAAVPAESHAAVPASHAATAVSREQPAGVTAHSGTAPSAVPEHREATATEHAALPAVHYPPGSQAPRGATRTASAAPAVHPAVHSAPPEAHAAASHPQPHPAGAAAHHERRPGER